MPLPAGSNREIRLFFHASTKKGGIDFMAKKPKVPEQDNPVTAPDTDILPESQQSEQTVAPPFEPDTQPPEVAAEDMAAISEEAKAVDIAPNISEEVQPPEPISFEAFKAAQEAATSEMPAPEEEQEDTRQEWEEPLAEIEAEQQTKRRGRPPKAAEDKDTSGQIGPKSDKSANAEKATKQPKAEKAAKPPKEEKAPEPPAPPEPVTPPEPIDATRPGEVEVYPVVRTK